MLMPLRLCDTKVNLEADHWCSAPDILSIPFHTVWPAVGSKGLFGFPDINEA